MPWYYVFWVGQMHIRSEKESSLHIIDIETETQKGEVFKASGALVLCSFYQTKLTFCTVSIQQESLCLMADRDVKIPTYIAKSIEARNFTQYFLLENQTCFISFFFTIYLNISHIQNRYNLIFLLVWEARLLWNHGRGWKWDWQRTNAEFKEEDNVGQMICILLFRDKM